MAKDLNKHRIRSTKCGFLLAVMLGFLAHPVIDASSAWHQGFLVIGVILISLCVLGRMYCTAFLGGHKNQTLICYGPFSIVRNPLYACSFVGVCGLAFISGYITYVVLLPLMFLAIYVPLIRREESFLAEHFGQEYHVYTATVPRLVPKFSLYWAPETIEMQPKFMLFALRDSMLWLSIFPLFVFIRQLHTLGILPTYFQLL